MKALLEEKQVDFEASGLKYLSNDARVGQPCYHLRFRLRFRLEQYILLKVTGLSGTSEVRLLAEGLAVRCKQAGWIGAL